MGTTDEGPVLVWVGVAIILAVLWAVGDVRNNRRHGGWGVGHTLGRLPLAFGLAVCCPPLLAVLLFRVRFDGR